VRLFVVCCAPINKETHMFIVRSIAQAQGGRRDEAAGVMKEFAAAAHKDLGWAQSRILTGSIGPSDSTIVMETEVATLAAFEQQLDSVNNWPGMKVFGPKFADVFISGSHHFEILRIC
jgi:hypothetical protein